MSARGIRFAKGLPLAPIGTDEQFLGEDTLLWGEQARILFPGVFVGEGLLQASSPQQLCKVVRNRPTTFQIAAMVDFESGWTGLTSTVTIVFTYQLGVGTVRQTLQRITAFAPPGGTFAAPVAPLFLPVQFSDLFQLPGQALNGSVSLSFTPAGAGFVSGNVTALVGIYAAPVFA
jgi:hypothetical protein